MLGMFLLRSHDGRDALYTQNVQCFSRPYAYRVQAKRLQRKDSNPAIQQVVYDHNGVLASTKILFIYYVVKSSSYRIVESDIADAGAVVDDRSPRRVRARPGPDTI